MSVVLQKAENEVKYWLKEHNKTLDDETITNIAARSVNLFVSNNWSSLEAAAEHLLTFYFNERA